MVRLGSFEMYTELSLKVLAARNIGLIKSNTVFWNLYSNEQSFLTLVEKNHSEIDNEMAKIRDNLKNGLEKIGIVCIFDPTFPAINYNVKNKSEKPYILLYRGEISLLSNLNNNVAVIGLTTPDKSIKERERDFVYRLVERNITVVSGLAIGCDSIAHESCLEKSGITIAILPSTLTNVAPSINRKLAERIVENGGLLVSEYYLESRSKFEVVQRYLERDRLQAMFSKAIILTASYRKDEGDSGSRHAMMAAYKYGIPRYVLYNSSTDSSDSQFGLNTDLLTNDLFGTASILTGRSIDEIEKIHLDYFDVIEKQNFVEQLKII